jgi:hypothetical protein
MALGHRVKKLEDAIAPQQVIRAMYVYEGCDTEAEIAARIVREPPGKGGALNLCVVLYTCPKQGTPHSHADERFWDPSHPPRRNG